jgi:hypothetical protein
MSPLEKTPFASQSPTEGKRKSPPVKPSEYIQERLLSTAQRLAKSATDDADTVPEISALLPDKEGSVTDYLVPIDKPLFQPSPARVCLQSFEPFKTYEVLINFRNIDKVRPQNKLLRGKNDSMPSSL